MNIYLKPIFALCLYGILSVSLATHAFAKSYIISPLPLPQQEILNISTEKCGTSCLLNYFAKGEFFSFVAFFDPSIDNTELRSKLSSVLGDLGIADQMLPPTLQGSGKIKLALLMPKKIIGRYSASSIDTILAYLMTRGNDFVFEIFDSGDESRANLNSAYKNIAKENYDFVIAILTPKGAQEFATLDISLPTYVPTINRKQINISSLPKNLIFGGIDYEAQIELLLSLAGSKNIIAYNDKSLIGKTLGGILKNKSSRVVFEEEIDSESAKTFVQKLSKHDRLIANNVVFFNTPPARTGLVASQLGLAKNKPDKFLSVQTNFHPQILLLIQKEDRKNLFIANVINNQNPKLVEYTSLLGGDLRYDWVNYATAVGVEQLILAQINQGKRFFNERVKDGQVEYINRIYKSDAKSFYEYR